jgi:hypothetical protein
MNRTCIALAAILFPVFAWAGSDNYDVNKSKDTAKGSNQQQEKKKAPPIDKLEIEKPRSEPPEEKSQEQSEHEEKYRVRKSGDTTEMRKSD